VRSRIGSRGDIVPIMYNEAKHDFVIFKIAYRIYFFNRGPARGEGEHRIWVLPYSERELSNPAVLEAIYERTWYLGDLSLRCFDNANGKLLGIVGGYLMLWTF